MNLLPNDSKNHQPSDGMVEESTPSDNELTSNLVSAINSKFLDIENPYTNPTCVVKCELYENNLLPVKIAGRDFVAVLDTGADCSVMGFQFMKELQKYGPLNITVGGTSGIEAVGQYSMAAYGLCDLNMELGDIPVQIKAKVLKNLRTKLILGNDFINKYKAIINISERQAQFTIHNVPLRSIKQITVQPMQEVSIPVQIEDPNNDKLPIGLVGQLSSSLEDNHPLKGGWVVSKIHPGSKMAYRLYNTTDQPYTIQRGQRVAYFSSLKDTEIYLCHANNVVSEDKINTYHESTSTDNVVPFGSVPQATDKKVLTPINDDDINLDGSYLTPGEQDQLRELIKRNREVFALNLQELGHARGPPCRIHLKEGSTPVRKPPYKASPKVQEQIDQEIKKMLDAGIISHSDSEFSSPLVVVQKPDSSIRLCTDYRALNEISLEDAYPLPPVGYMLDLLGTVKPRYISILDLASGYYQIPIDPRDRHKTAFVSIHGLYEYNVLPFGLNSSGPKFCRFVNTVLKGILNKFAFIYVDDIICVSPSFEQHLKDLQEIFDRFQSVNMKLKLKKCHFARKSVKYLGHVVSNEGIHVDPEKLNPVTSFPAPQNVKEVRRFLGLTNFYRRHVQNYSQIAAPISNLTRKEVKFKWDNDCKKAMETLKQALVSAPVLGYADYSRPFILSADCSGVALGSILSQMGEDGVERVIGFHGRMLNKCERKYSGTEREALAIFDSLKHFRHYIQSVPITIKTDHQPLRGVFQNEIQPRGRISKWLAAMSQYDYNVVYVPGDRMKHVDALSRRPYNVGNDSRQNADPVISPFFEMEEDNSSENVYFPPMHVATQTDNDVDYQVKTDKDGSNNDKVHFLTNPPTYDMVGHIEIISGIPYKLYAPSPIVDQVYGVVTRSQTEHERLMDEQYKAESQPINLHDETQIDNDLVLEGEDLPLGQMSEAEIIIQQRRDPNLLPMINYLEKGILPSNPDQSKTIIIQSEFYSIENQMLYHHTYGRKEGGYNRTFQIVVPNCFKRAILYDTHDSILGGHRGIPTTILKIREKYYWKTLEKDVASWVKSCPRCQKRGKVMDHKKAPLEPITPSIPLYHWQIDVCGPLTRASTGHRYILTCIDIYTKFVVYIPMKEISAPSVARALFEEIFCSFGVAAIVQSDQGSNFNSAITKALCNIMGVKLQFSSAYHSQSQGCVERDHAVLTDHLAKYVSMEGAGEDWVNFLKPAQYCHNNTTHYTLKMAPNLLVFGRVLRMPNDLQCTFLDTLPQNLNMQVGFLVQKINECQLQADEAIMKAQAKMKLQYDKKTKDIQYSAGELVWLYVPCVPLQMSRKLKSPWVGPFRILNRVSTLNYELRSEVTNKKLKYPVHVNRLRKFFTCALRPSDDHELREMYSKDPDLHLTDIDIQKENFVDEDDSIEKNAEGSSCSLEKYDSQNLKLANDSIQNLPTKQVEPSRMPGSGGGIDPRQILRRAMLAKRDLITSPSSSSSSGKQTTPNNDISSETKKGGGNSQIVVPPRPESLKNAGNIKTMGESHLGSLPQVDINDIPNSRPFTTITHGRSTDNGTQYAVVYNDQENKKVPTWVDENKLSEEEKTYIEANPVRVLRPRISPVS
jgi:hypothetical protein